MFSSLIDGARELRIPLATGYSFVLTTWLLLAGRDPISGELGQNFRSLFDFLGPGAVVALVSVAATLIGGALERSVLDEARHRLGRFFGHLNWPAPGTSPPPFDRKGFEYRWNPKNPPTQEYIEVNAWIARHAAESEFRLSLAMVSFPPLVVMASQGTAPAWWTMLLLPVGLWCDGIAIQNTFIAIPYNALVEQRRWELVHALSHAATDLDSENQGKANEKVLLARRNLEQARHEQPEKVRFIRGFNTNEFKTL